MLKPRRRDHFTPAPLPLRRAPELVEAAEQEAPSRSRLVRRVLAFVAVVGLSVAVVASTSGTDAFKSGTAGVQGWFAAQVAQGSELIDRHLRQARVADELALITAERDELALQVMRLEAVEREHQRLVALLEMSEPAGLDGAVGRVIARPTAGRQTLRLDIGRERGVELGQAVVAHDGLVGQVVDVGNGWADVLLASDTLHSAAVRLPASEVHGTLVGTGDGLRVDHIIAATEVEIGDAVLTSGEGGVFPRGIAVGHVRSVARDTGPLLRIELEPAAMPSLLAEVFVVRSQQLETP